MNATTQHDQLVVWTIFAAIATLAALAAWAANSLETEVRRFQQLERDSKMPPIRKSLLGQRRLLTCEDIVTRKKGVPADPAKTRNGASSPHEEKKITLRGGQPQGRNRC